MAERNGEPFIVKPPEPSKWERIGNWLGQHDFIASLLSCCIIFGWMVSFELLHNYTGWDWLAIIAVLPVCIFIGLALR